MKNFKFKNKYGPVLSKANGFTLIETLVAIMIISLVITSVVSLMASSIFSARYAKNEIKATYIAQEGIDYIRNLRDSIVFHGYGSGSWTSFTTALNDATSGCSTGCIILQPMTYTKLAVGPVPSTALLVNEFRHTIRTEVCPPSTCNEIKIISKVEWKNGNSIKSRELKASLTNWN